VVVVDPAPCPCGRTLTRLRSLHGRSDDMLTVRGVQVHPLQFAALAREPGVREFQVVQHRDRLTLRIAPTADAPAGLAPRLTRRVGAALGELGIPDPQIAVELCAHIERPASGKLQLVIADPLSASRPGRRRRGRTPLR
jgi:phenylacetate-CoA ligase